MPQALQKTEINMIQVRVYMPEVLVEPQFQVVTHIQTGAKTGRIYFPALFLLDLFAGLVKLWNACIQRQNNTAYQVNDEEVTDKPTSQPSLEPVNNPESLSITM